MAPFEVDTFYSGILLPCRRHCRHPCHAPRRMPPPRIVWFDQWTLWTFRDNRDCLSHVWSSPSREISPVPIGSTTHCHYQMHCETTTAQSYNRIRDSSMTLDACSSLNVGASCHKTTLARAQGSSVSCALHVRWGAPRRTVRIGHKRSGQGNGRERQYHERTTVQLDSEAWHTSTWNVENLPTTTDTRVLSKSTPPTCAVLSLGSFVGKLNNKTDCEAFLAWFEHDTTTVLDKSHAQPPQTDDGTESHQFEHSFGLGVV